MTTHIQKPKKEEEPTNHLKPDGHFEWLSAENFTNAHDWWDIYTQSFPPHERDTKQQLTLALHKHIAQIGCYRINHAMAAIVVLYKMHTPSFAFLHYFAVAKAWRNQNLGSKLFQQLLPEAEKFVLKTSKKSLGLIWEVEDPSEAENDLDKHIQTKRISFYHRQGGKLFNTKFIQPAIGNYPPVPLQLMSHSNNKKLAEKDIASAIYFQKYQVINGIDTKQLTDLLNTCHEKV
jgi:GNAT superfamily N-acetyltransferase